MTALRASQNALAGRSLPTSGLVPFRSLRYYSVQTRCQAKRMTPAKFLTYCIIVCQLFPSPNKGITFGDYFYDVCCRVGSITLIQFNYNYNYNYSLKCFNYITITPCKKYQITIIITTFWFVFTFSLAQKLLDCTWWTLGCDKFLTPVNFFLPYKSSPQLKKLFLTGLMLLLVPNNPWLK